MRTKDDRCFCNLLACANNIGVRKMPYMAYLMQISGFELNYRYSIRLDSIKSHGLINSLGDLVASGFVTRGYQLTETGEANFNGFYITNVEDKLCNHIVSLVEKLNVSQLYMICTTDIMMQETLRTGGYRALKADKEDIKKTVKDLCPQYTEDSFNNAVKIVRELRRGKIDEK